jgi:hypothetical protein
MRRAVVASVALTASLVPAVAWADGGSLFGHSGQLVLSDDQPMASIVSTSLLGVAPSTPGSQSTVSFQYGTVNNGGGSGTEVSFAPSGDYFAFHNLSFGAEILVGFLQPAAPSNSAGGSSSPADNYLIFGIAPRIGYNVAISDLVSFWPKIYFGYQTASGNNDNGGANQELVGLFAPFLFHLAPHFFFGVGPNFSTVLGNNTTGGGGPSTPGPKVTQFGLQATLGGWFLGT